MTTKIIAGVFISMSIHLLTVIPTLAGDSRSLVEGTILKSCQELGELACVTSTECMLQLDENSAYVCRQAANSCEQGFVQVSSDIVEGSPILDLQALCEGKSGCSYSPGNCYCPPVEGLACFCARGEPPSCRPQ